MSTMPSAHDSTPFVLHSVCLNFDLPDTLPYVSYLRKMVRGMIAHLNVSRQDTDDLETIIGELATNVVRHAKSGTYKVIIEFNGGLAVVQVIDQGAGFSLAATPEPGTVRADELAAKDDQTVPSEDDNGVSERIGGFGLPLVHSLAEQVDITTNPHPARGMTVRAAKHLQPLQ